VGGGGGVGVWGVAKSQKDATTKTAFKSTPPIEKKIAFQ
jgi:hypothetical protein